MQPYLISLKIFDITSNVINFVSVSTQRVTIMLDFIAKQGHALVVDFQVQPVMRAAHHGDGRTVR